MLLKACGIGIGVIGIVGYTIKAVSYPTFTRLLGLNNINEDWYFIIKIINTKIYKLLHLLSFSIYLLYILIILY